MPKILKETEIQILKKLKEEKEAHLRDLMRDDEPSEVL